MSLITKTSVTLLILCLSTFTLTKTHHKLLKIDEGKSPATPGSGITENNRFYPNCNKGCGKCVFDDFAVYCTGCYMSLLTKQKGTTNNMNWTCGDMQKDTTSLKGCLATKLMNENSEIGCLECDKDSGFVKISDNDSYDKACLKCKD